VEGRRKEQRNEEVWREIQLDGHEKRKMEEWKGAKKENEKSGKEEIIKKERTNE
jgi:hypothetical protein